MKLLDRVRYSLPSLDGLPCSATLPQFMGGPGHPRNITGGIEQGGASRCIVLASNGANLFWTLYGYQKRFCLLRGRRSKRELRPYARHRE